MTVGRRAPIAFVLNTPSGKRGRLRVTEILSALAEPFEQHTDLEMVAVDAAAAAECEGGLGCLSRRAPRAAHLMLVISYFAASDERPDRVAALLVDMGAVDACISDPFGGNNVDACVSERGVLQRPPPKSFRQASEARAALAQLVQEDLRPTLESTGHWEPTGQVLLSGVPAGAAVLVDEETAGVAPGGSILLSGLSPATHQVSYSVGAVVVQGQRITISRGKVTELTFEAIAAEGYPRALLWGGAGLAAVGTAITVWSAVYASGQTDYIRTCGQDPCGATFLTLGQQLRGDIYTFQPDPNRGSVLALPLGYSMAATGAVWAGGSQLVQDDLMMHGLVAGVGVIVGALAYGLSAGLNAGR